MVKPNTKKCIQCLIEFPLDFFYKGSNGYYISYCKKCSAIRSKRWIILNKDSWKKIAQRSSKKYRENPIVKKQISKYYKNWYKLNGRNRVIDYQGAIVEWMKNHPKEVKARRLIGHYIKIGKIIKPKNCSLCSRETRLSGHHLDYDKPLDAIWLCSSCHKNIHSKIKSI